MRVIGVEGTFKNAVDAALAYDAAARRIRGHKAICNFVPRSELVKDGNYSIVKNSSELINIKSKENNNKVKVALKKQNSKHKKIEKKQNLKGIHKKNK